jgi:hypothetical protein
MSTQAIDQAAGAPSATTSVEQLAAAALGSFWRALGRLGPLWLLGTVFIALKVVLANAPLVGATPLERSLAAATAGFFGQVAPALVSGVAIRMFLGRQREAWRVDRHFWRYIGIVSLLGVAPVAVSVWAAAVGPLAVPGDPVALFGAVALTAAPAALAIWVALRLALWPIGRLMGAADLAPQRSWSLMRGAAAGAFGAALLLGAPLFILAMIPVMATSHGDVAQGELAAAPLLAALNLVVAAVAAEVYRARNPELIPRPTPRRRRKTPIADPS